MAKIIDLDPRKRMTDEAFNSFKQSIAELQLEDIHTLTVIHTPPNGATKVQSFGLDWQTIGVTQAILNALAQELLAQEYSSKEHP